MGHTSPTPDSLELLGSSYPLTFEDKVLLLVDTVMILHVIFNFFMHFWHSIPPYRYYRSFMSFKTTRSVSVSLFWFLAHLSILVFLKLKNLSSTKISGRWTQIRILAMLLAQKCEF